MQIRILLIILTAFLFNPGSFSQPLLKLTEQTINLKNKLAFTLRIPQSYKITPAAEGLERPRFFAKSPDGRLFITDMHDRSDNKKGRLLILGNWNDKDKSFDTVITFLDGLRNPNQVIFYSSNDQYFLYIAETDKLSYYKYKAGDNKPSSPQTIIATFPDYGLHYKYGGWHLTRSLAIHNNKLYVSVGSSCNACIETGEIRATIVEMDPDGRNQRYYARGLRNAVGIEWVNNELWVTNMGRDGIGPDKPEDLLHTIQANGYYGWPFYFQFRKHILVDPVFKDSVHPVYAIKPAIARWGFKAHSAPLGFEFFSNFGDSTLNNSFIVALHGSTSVWRQRGNAVVQMMPDGTYREIVTGFLRGKTENKRFGRPCDVFQWTNNSFFYQR